MKIRGFTIIELMITIAILGILATIAVPAYQNYTIRARVTEGLSLVEPAKLSVAESAHSNGGQLPATAAAAGYQPPSATRYVSSIGIANGVITVTYTPLAGNGTIIFTPTVVSNSGEITWTCNTGTLIDSFRPPNCRLGTNTSTGGSSTTTTPPASGGSSGNGNSGNNGNNGNNGNSSNSSNSSQSFWDWLLGLFS